MPRDRAVRVAIISLVLALVLTLPVGASMYATSAKKAVSPDLVPTKVCSCDLPSAMDQNSSSPSELRGHGPPGPSNQTAYDEQLGITFAQDFTSLEYNVTAVSQTDPSLDTGPAYLLNGLSDTGFWYQVGLSYNWGPGQAPGTGFDMNYEVFGPFGNSIDPRQGGGIEAFSGPVNQGDTVVLNLYFSSSGEVVIMIAEDLNTGAYAQQAFSAEGGSYFAGLASTVANPNGFFTGLMTEWYHGAPYYANPAEVVYSTNLSISSGWMWMDEWNPNNYVAVFTANASAPSTFTSAPSTLQEYSYGSMTEYADATEFITGAPNSTSSSSTTTTVAATTVTTTASSSSSSSSSSSTTAMTTSASASSSSSPSATTIQQSITSSSSYTATTTSATTIASSSFLSSTTTSSSTTQSVVVTTSTTSVTTTAIIVSTVVSAVASTTTGAAPPVLRLPSQITEGWLSIVRALLSLLEAIFE